jgi:hypothetical protein
VSVGHRLTAAIAAFVAIFVVAVLLAVLVVRPTNAVGSPSQSRLRVIEEVFPPRRLTVAEINRGGPSCLDGATLVVPVSGGCTFIAPKGVHVLVFRRVQGSPAMTITLNQTGDLTQSVDTALPGPDPADPLRLRFATVHDQTTVTLYGCRGPSACRLVVSQ